MFLTQLDRKVFRATYIKIVLELDVKFGRYIQFFDCELEKLHPSHPSIRLIRGFPQVEAVFRQLN